MSAGSSSGGASSGGFHVDPAALQGAAGRLGRAYDEFQSVITDSVSVQYSDNSPASLGDGVVEAWLSFGQAWGAEAGVMGQALVEMITRLYENAANYKATEDDNTASLIALLPS